MPQGRGQTKGRKKAAPKAPEETAETPVNGILVRLTPDDAGNQQLTVQQLGEVKLTEAPTLLRLAAQNAEKTLGVE